MTGALKPVRYVFKCPIQVLTTPHWRPSQYRKPSTPNYNGTTDDWAWSVSGTQDVRLSSQTAHSTTTGLNRRSSSSPPPNLHPHRHGSCRARTGQGSRGQRGIEGPACFPNVTSQSRGYLVLMPS